MEVSIMTEQNISIIKGNIDFRIKQDFFIKAHRTVCFAAGSTVTDSEGQRHDVSGQSVTNDANYRVLLSFIDGCVTLLPPQEEQVAIVGETPITE
jgi:hypothetical protein